MDPPQATQDAQSNIFRKPDGTSMPVFAEAGGIQGRPKLMRRLRVRLFSVFIREFKEPTIPE